nr:dienelactone hydrolase family protein [Shewanella insulae]
MVTDIFGLCQSTDNLLSFLSAYTGSVNIVEPYGGVRHSFKDEKEAYSAFVENCGHDKYLNLAKQLICATNPDKLIGFSAGASVLWRFAAEESISGPAMLGFYPSQIRHHLDLIPKHELEIIFPRKEDSFDVASVCECIEKHANVTAKIVPYDHGFMNSSSKAYDQNGESYGLSRIDRFLNF